TARYSSATAISSSPSPKNTDGMFEIRQIDHVAFTVRDLEWSIAWYHDVLGLERRHEDVWGRVPAMMCAGDTGVALFPAATSNPDAAPEHANTTVMRHLAFQVDRDNFVRAQTELACRGIPFNFEDHQISHSFFFKQQTAYEIELTTYELDDAA